MEAEAAPTPTPQGRARFTNLAALGLFLAGLAPLIMLLAGLVFGLEVGEMAAFFLIPAAVGFLAAFLVLKFGTWAKIVGILAALLIMGALFWTFFGVFIPASFFDFVPGLLVIPGGIIAIVGCIKAILARRRGNVGEAPIGGERTAIRVILSVIGLLAVVSGILTIAGRTQAPDTVQAAATLQAKNFEWDKDSYTVPSGSTILVRNSDPFFHTATIDALNIDEAVTPGAEKTIRISQPGTYILYCQPHTSEPENPGEDDMATTIVVT